MLIVVDTVYQDIEVCERRYHAAFYLHRIGTESVNDWHWGVQPDGLLDA